MNTTHEVKSTCMYASGSEVEKFTDDRIQKEHEDTKIQQEMMAQYFYTRGQLSNPFSTLNDSDRFFPGTVFEFWTLL